MNASHSAQRAACADAWLLVAAVLTLDDKDAAAGVWEDRSIDVRAQVHVLWLDKDTELLYLDQATDHKSTGGSSASPFQSRASSALSRSRPSTSEKDVRPFTGIHVYTHVCRPSTSEKDVRPFTGNPKP